MIGLRSGSSRDKKEHITYIYKIFYEYKFNLRIINEKKYIYTRANHTNRKNTRALHTHTSPCFYNLPNRLGNKSLLPFIFNPIMSK